MTTLREHLEGAYEAPDDDEGRATFRIDNPDVAEWAMRKLARATDQLAEIGTQAGIERQRIIEWQYGEERRVERDREFFEALLIDWHRRSVDAETEAGTDWKHVTKTRNLPSGKVSARKAPTWTWEDPDAFVEWAEGADRHILVRVVKTPDKMAIKAELTVDALGMVVDSTTGDIVPGVTVDPGEVTYSVTVALDAEQRRE